jgi:hypothetical protein
MWGSITIEVIIKLSPARNSDIFSSKHKLGSNIFSQIRGDLEELAQGKGMFTLQ